MGRALRMGLFLAAWSCLLPSIVTLAGHMPSFGAHALPYGDLINTVAPLERRVSNMVSAVNFDYRGFDTLGEEFMLVCAVTGVVVILRGNRGEGVDVSPGVVSGRPLLPRSDVTVLVATVYAPLVVLFGMYVGLHAMTTPGGGFQGGVIVASGCMVLFLGQGYGSWRRVMRSPLLDVCEGAGALLYAACGLVSMARGLPFLQNFLPLGVFRDVNSGGSMLVENIGVLLAVTGGFACLFGELLEETRALRAGAQP